MAGLKDLKTLTQGMKLKIRKSDKELQQQGARAFMLMIERENCPFRKTDEDRERRLWMMGWKRASNEFWSKQRRSEDYDRAN